MGAIVEQMGFAGQGVNRGYLNAGSRAIKRCLDLAGIKQEQVGMIINAGLYPDKYIQEPAFASLLYGKQRKRLAHHLYETFSFDLHEGGGGVVMAMRVLSGFIDSGKIQKGMIVAGDAMRLKGKPKEFTLSAKAGALLLGAGRVDEGFIHFDQSSYTQYAELYKSYTHNVNGRLKLIVEEDINYNDTCLSCVEESVHKLLQKRNMKQDEIDLYLPSQSPVGFTDKFRQRYGDLKVIRVKDKGELYSVGIMAALDKAIQSERFGRARNSLFISVGPGITVDLALYRNPFS
jgi:3-oxoacyl-[acyl-carrier-protein] synthase-3